MSEQKFQETHKPHIVKLPVVEFPQYKVTDTEVAVSIPLFWSDIDSATLKENSLDRLKNVHCHGAIWAAMSLVNNTDLADRGVGIYFHVEDTVYDALLPVFDAFKVPKSFIRPMRIDAPELPHKIVHPLYGKKLMCVEDRQVNTARWLIMDSDAFVCSSEKRLLWYDKLKVFENPSAIKSFNSDYGDDTQYRIWVRGVCLAAGIPFSEEDDLFAQEQRAFYALGHWQSDRRPSRNKLDRPVISTQLFLLPVHHDLTSHLREYYKTCYQDEFLLCLWQYVYGDISDLKAKMGGLNMYDFETQYIERDKSLDKDGYIAHIVPDAHGEQQDRVDDYFDDFFEQLGSKVDDSQNDTLSVSAALQKTRSDKEHPKGHRYGEYYDMLFGAMVHQKGRKLRVLEIGVSLFGHGSFEAFGELDIVDKVVGIDLMHYIGKISDKMEFHRADAYKISTIEMLKNKHPDGFDIIIDDGTHLEKHQRFFLEEYGGLLTVDGKLVCEDVKDKAFFREMCADYNCYGFDGWANKHDDIGDDEHFERILIRDQKHYVPRIKSQADTISYYTPPAQKHFFVLDVPYAHGGYIACAFHQRVLKWCEAMYNLGHKITYIGHKDRKVACTEHVAVTDNETLEKTYGSSDYIAFPEHSPDDLAFQTFRHRAKEEIRARAKEDDFVLAFYGLGHQNLCEDIADLPVIVVEPSIGYPDAFSENRVYQSTAKMHFTRGQADINHFLQEKFPDHPYNQYIMAQYNTMPYTLPDRNSCFIPNFFDFDHFEPREDKEDVICFVGRINVCKGLHDAFQLASYTDTTLLLAGVGRLDQCGLDVPKQVEFLGVADEKLRSDIFGRSLMHVCPSLYIEPFLGSGVESLFCMTPHGTTNWGAPTDWCIHGKTGYRVQNFDHLVWAFENIHKIDGKDCYHQALQYSKARAAISYHEYFNMLLQNKNGGRWSINPDRTNLQWLNADMTKEEIDAATAEIQAQIAA